MSDEEPEVTVRYSRKFLQTEGRKRRRSLILGGIVCLAGSVALIVEGVHAWRTNSLVDMGPRSGFAKYPPEIVVPMGLLGLALSAYGIWAGLSTRSTTDQG
jgi:hypothetical protein